MNLKFMASISFLFALNSSSFAQVLNLSDALERAIAYHDKIKSKQIIVQSTAQNTIFQNKQYLPDLTLGAQQSFGTINAQNGPLYAHSGLGSAATSMPLAEQNWNAAFGSLYFANINWNAFTFGKRKHQIALATTKEGVAVADMDQVVFEYQVKVTAAYLNLLASQRLKFVQRKNTERAQVFFEMTDSRATSGLIPEVDASLAKAEVSHAKSLEIKAYDKELAFSKNLAVLLNDKFQSYQLDSLYNTRVPVMNWDGNISVVKNHPALEWQQRRIEESKQHEQFIRSHKMPNFNLFAVAQARGSGFDWNYVQDNTAYSSSYLKGAGIQRSNYLLGGTLSWNLTNIFRFNSKVKEQQFQTAALKQDFTLLQKELLAETGLAQEQFKNASDNLEETKIQLTASQVAYKQHTALYENGLTNLVDFTQALYSLNRAEIDYEIAQNNVWQALLLLASAQGDISILLKATQY
ncbi:transporter [Sphingobacterium sp. ML3W]|uniref:TolC family protein n=1 Tax=Sphingobacterium sp. ML3W TaxID=1538644 RepID=UPI0004F8E183|nr:TolC family protein [Sphingobacterium sp. ML3W]AIM36947.1 transporter [Sphingobacterium sp. ML3W]